MHTLTINLPDSMDPKQERQMLATSWYQAGKLTAVQAAEIAGLSVSTFLTMTEPQTQTDRLLQQMARPMMETYDLEALKQAKQLKVLDWDKLDRLAETIGIEEPVDELIRQIGQ